jgi:DNA-binding MarR family transcriptional regulator
MPDPFGISLDRYIEIAEFRANLRAFLRHNEQACRQYDLTPQRFLVLLAVKGAPDGTERLSFTELSRRLQLSRNTVTELCARAEEAGLLTREGSETDQRVVYLRVTKEGERRLAGVIEASDGYRGELRAAFVVLTDSFHVATRRPRKPRGRAS